MRVVILGAGLGRRLKYPDPLPKILLRFGGKSLLARHVAFLRSLGVARIDLVVGYRAEDVEAELALLGASDLVQTHYNPEYCKGSIVSLWAVREILESGEPVLFMDGDVLYDLRLLQRLIDASPGNCFLMDRTTEQGEDPVKICFQGETLVDFHKKPKIAHDWWGEWVGFARFTPTIASKIARRLSTYVNAGRLDEMYEEGFRDVILEEPKDTFEVIDVTDLPWVEIDFPEDLERARREIFPDLASTLGELVAE